MDYKLLMEQANLRQKEKARELTVRQTQEKEEELEKKRIEIEKRKMQSSMIKQSLTAKHSSARPFIQDPVMTSRNPSKTQKLKDNKIQTEIKAKHRRKQIEPDGEKAILTRPEVTPDSKANNKTELSHKKDSKTKIDSQTTNLNPSINTQLKMQNRESIKKTNKESCDKNEEINKAKSEIKESKKPPTYEEILKLATNNSNTVAKGEIDNVFKLKFTPLKDSSSKIEQPNDKNKIIQTKTNLENNSKNSETRNKFKSEHKEVPITIGEKRKTSDTKTENTEIKRKKPVQKEILKKNNVEKSKSKEKEVKPPPPPKPRPKIQPSAYAQKIFEMHSKSSITNKFNYKPVKNKPNNKRDLEDEYSHDDGFIVSDDDDESNEDVRKYIRSMFKRPQYSYDRSIDDASAEAMESNFSQQQREEKRSARIGLKEDLEDIEREKQKYKIKRVRQ